MRVIEDRWWSMSSTVSGPIIDISMISFVSGAVAPKNRWALSLDVHTLLYHLQVRNRVPVLFDAEIVHGMSLR